MKKRGWSTAAAIGISATVLLAACGSDNKSSSSTAAATPTSAGAAATTAAGGAATTTGGSPTTAAGSTATTTGGATATTASGGSAPASEGSTVPASQLGLIDGVYKGTGGFEIDPKDCPADWDPKQGITDTEINLFTSMPTSGPFAGFGLLGDGMKAYFKYINDNGGIDGRKIIFDIEGRRLPAGQDQDERRRGAGCEQVRRARHGARHGEQPGRLGRDQRRVHAAVVQRHRCRPVG